MGSLSYGELAGRTDAPWSELLNDPEEEADCFSDNTPQQPLITERVLGIQNGVLGGLCTHRWHVWSTGPSLSDLVAARTPILMRNATEPVDHQCASFGPDEDRRPKQACPMNQMMAAANKGGGSFGYGGGERPVARRPRHKNASLPPLGVDNVGDEGFRQPRTAPERFFE